MARNEDFHSEVKRPPGLTVSDVRRATEHAEQQLTDLVDIYFEQANVFSALVGIFATRALDSISVYEKRRHVDLAQQRFPDLRHREASEPPSPRQSLECKASKRPWPVQSHYNHAGWYIVWRYLVDPTCALEEGRPVLIWRVDLVYLEEEDWKYEGSTAGPVGGGRTHTFGLKKPAKKLRGCAIYSR